MQAAPSPWSPVGFKTYRTYFPRTPPLVPEPDLTLTQRFCQRWFEEGTPGGRPLRRQLEERCGRTTVIFVRGFLGNYMPGNMVEPCAALRRLGFDAHILRNRAGGTFDENVADMARALARLDSSRRLIFCGHSRGGLEALLLLAGHPALAARCDGVILSQTSRGACPVLESLLLRAHQGSLRGRWRRASEVVQRAGLYLLGAHRGGRGLIGEALKAAVARVDAAPRGFPVIQTASWSSRPTAWLDSFHERLGEIAPGCAHDGQFYLSDLIWPGLPHVLLPHLDHSQPVMGGFGFDHVRYWEVMLSLLLEEQG